MTLTEMRNTIGTKAEYLDSQRKEKNMAKTDFDVFAKELLPLVGGKENISYLTHCITRIRMNVKDKNLVKTDEISKLSGQMGCQWAGEQLQVIIGANVADAYQAFARVSGAGEEQPVSEESTERKKISINAVFDAISGCVTPIIPILIAGGMLKVILMLAEMAGVSPEHPTYFVVNFVSDAAFYFMPIFIGANVARKFGANMGLGMLMGALFLHPNFISAVAEGTSLSFFGIPIYAASYASSVFPVILTVWVMAPIEKFIAKHSPKVLRTLVEPLATSLIMIPLALCLLGPLGSLLGTYISSAVLWLYDVTGFLGVGIFTAIFPLLVITGMHSGFTPYLINILTSGAGAEPIVLVGMLVSNINQSAATFGVAVKSRNIEVKSNAVSCGVSALLGGVTEPALYGINLRYKTPLYACLIGNFAGGIIAGLGHVMTYAITGGSGLIGLATSYIPGGIGNVIWAVAAIVIGMAVTFALTLVLYKEEGTGEAEATGKTETAGEEEAAKETASCAPGTLYAPAEGEILPMEDIPDPTFAEGVLGYGCGIEPAKPYVYAPFDGTVISVADTKHAIGVKSKDGMEVLIHVGIDTVAMKGRGFAVQVKEGDTVRCGQQLMKFDQRAIFDEGYSSIVVVIVTNSFDYKALNMTKQGSCVRAEEILTAEKE